MADSRLLIPHLARPLTVLVLLAVSVAVQAEVARDDLVLFRQAGDVPAERVQLFGGADAKILNSAADGRRVWLVELPSGWRGRLDEMRTHTMEILLLDGRLSWRTERLEQYDYFYLPAAAPASELAAGTRGARLLVYLDPPRPTDGCEARAIDTEALAWRAATVAQRDTGIRLALEVKDLLNVESTGQRTWLLRVGDDFTIPWEVHRTAEEGYLLEGDFRIGECLSSGTIVDEYAPGGYFYRPAGIAHSGPDSGSQNGALWLLRSPTHLTVEFLESCPDH